MAYELFIYPPDGAPKTVTPQAVIAAFTAVGLPFTEQPDQFGHWLVLDGIESALDLTIKDGIVTGAGFRSASADDPSLIGHVIEVFKALGMTVSDDEGDL